MSKEIKDLEEKEETKEKEDEEDEIVLPTWSIEVPLEIQRGEK